MLHGQQNIKSCWLVKCELWHQQSGRNSWARSCTGAEERSVKPSERHESVRTVNKLKFNRHFWSYRHAVWVCAHATGLFLNTNANLDWRFHYLLVGSNYEPLRRTARWWEQLEGPAYRWQDGTTGSCQRQSLL